MDNDLLNAVVGNLVPVDRSDEDFSGHAQTSASLGVQFMIPTGAGLIIPRVDVGYESEIYLGLDEGACDLHQEDKDKAGSDAYTLVDARLSWQNDAGDITVVTRLRQEPHRRALHHRRLGGSEFGERLQTRSPVIPAATGIPDRKT
ncbi:MAG: hypothetical protein U5K56_04500 [Halioglobus sp.]|nr:hypothetical protein [Halioglobus sp.]